jgi:hypothetical protein
VGDHAGFFHLEDDRSGRRMYTEGKLWALDGGWEREVTTVEHRAEYGRYGFPEWVRFTVVDDREQRREYRAVRIMPGIVPAGFGYVGGWDDGGNPGVWRGAHHEETYEWDVTRPGPGLPLGPTEFASRFEYQGDTGMTYMEHMRYPPRWELEV